MQRAVCITQQNTEAGNANHGFHDGEQKNKSTIIQRHCNLATLPDHSLEIRIKTESILNIWTLKEHIRTSTQSALFSNASLTDLNNCKRQETYNAAVFTSNFKRRI